MKTAAKIISFLSLLLTLLPSFLVYGGIITLDLNKGLMLAGTIGWFVSAVFWMKTAKEAGAAE